MRHYILSIAAFLALPASIAIAGEASQDAIMETCRAVPALEEIIQANAPDYVPQFDACRKAIEMGIGGADAHYYYGRMLHRFGYFDEARAEFLKARSAGSTKGTLALGHLIVYGKAENEEETQEMLALFREAAEQGDPAAKVLLAFSYDFKLNPSPEETQKAFDLLEEASAQGYPIADYYLAEMYRFPGTNKQVNRELAVKYYRNAAAGGVAEAVTDLTAMGEDVSDFDDTTMIYKSVADRAIIIDRP